MSDGPPYYILITEAIYHTFSCYIPTPPTPPTPATPQGIIVVAGSSASAVGRLGISYFLLLLPLLGLLNFNF